MEQTERDKKLVTLIQALMKTDHGLGLINDTLGSGGLTVAPKTPGGDIGKLLADDPEAVTAALDEAGYAMLRQIEKTEFPIVTDPDRVANAEDGTILDTETTGLNPGEDRIVQLALLHFKYDEQGIISLGGFFNEYHDPGVPMSAEATEVTGITDEMLKGKKITNEQIKAEIGDKKMVVAHNAGFDRKFCEADFPDAGFVEINWHCSFAQIDWKARGMKGSSLELLALTEGYVYGAHDAYSDVAATAFVLNSVNSEGKTAFAEMYERGMGKSIMIIAEKCPFESKDDLKDAGYKWAADGTETGGIKAWFKVVPDLPEEIAAESEIIRGAYGRDVSLPAYEMDQKILYSSRRPTERVTFRTAEVKSPQEALKMLNDNEQPSLI
ncbi:MAG: 3'-5' exonuclease [Roseibium sp.]|uniref:3'-5' exonuclease n=1 Tax=Roseibium sp. TaxID=1936156 RepID=UPI0032995CFB